MEVMIFVFGIDYLKLVIIFVDISFFWKRVKIKSCNVKIDFFIIYVNDKDIVYFGKRFFFEFLGYYFLYVVFNYCMKDENVIRVVIKEFDDCLEKLGYLFVKKKIFIKM